MNATTPLTRFYVLQPHLTTEQVQAINAGHKLDLFARYMAFSDAKPHTVLQYLMATREGLLHHGWTIDGITLEDVFAIGNGGMDPLGEATRHPDGKSVSVGDVILASVGGAWAATVCAPFGWTLLDISETACRLILRGAGLFSDAILYHDRQTA